MNYLDFFKKTTFLLILTLFLGIFAFAQSAKFPAPRENQLLNGLKLLVWNEPKAEKITIKLRVHNGAAFDPKDKMGVMAMLADSLFPTAQAREFFVEDLEGSLEISSNYDYLQITASGKSSEILAMLETISTAVVNPQITPENFKTVSQARLEKVKQLEQNPDYIADLMVAKKLFGDFPYGRSIEGTSETLAKIDRADILFAKERFLTADNATLAIIGNVKPEYVHRVSRQLFGGWNKAEKKIPATFRQPDVADTKIERVNLADAKSLEIRRGWRASARNSADFSAMQILTQIWQNRLGNNKLEYNPHLLNGSLILKISTSPMALPAETNVIPLPMSAIEFNKDLATSSEFEKAKSEVLQAFSEKHISDLWLDLDTFKLSSVQKEFEKLQNVTFEDVKKLAEDSKNKDLVTVLVNKSESASATK